ncbi:hypothetical protein ACTFIY_009183 [Dictyostelium cf. discoideum]
MSLFKIKTITIDHTEKNIRISRSITINENSDRYICIPDEISNEESVEILDSVENGSTLLHSEKPSFPEDLKYFKNKKFKIQMVEGNHIFGKLIGSSNETKSITLNVESYHSFKSDNSLPNGMIKLEHSKILSYFLLSSDNDNNNNDDDGFYIKNNCERITKIEINNNKVKRDIIVNYNIHIQKQGAEFGHFIHLVKGLKSGKQLYCKANLKDDLPITIVTEYKWKPFIDIDSSDNVQLRIKTLAEKKKVIYKIDNLKCYNNITTNIQINKFQTTANRAILVYPGGPLQVSIYFKNNSKLFLTKTRCKLIQNDLIENENKEQTDDDDDDDDDEEDEDEDSDEEGDIFDTAFNSPPSELLPSISSVSSNRNNNNNISIKTNANPIRRSVNSDLFACQLLSIVKPNSIGIISFIIPTEKLKLFKDIGHQALFETRGKESNINQIKVSSVFTILETETLNKITYQVANISQHSIKLIIYTGYGIIGTETPLNEYTKVLITPTINENNNNNNNRVIEKIDETLYLIQNCVGFSIVNFELYNSKCKQLMTNSRLPQDALSLLNNNGISITYSPNVFKCHDLTHLSRNAQDSLFKFLGSITLEDKTSSYFNKPYLPGPLTNYLFDQTISSKSSGTSVLSNMVSSNPRVLKLGLFDSENPQSQQNDKHNNTNTPSSSKYGSSFIEGSFSSREDSHSKKSSRIIS